MTDPSEEAVGHMRRNWLVLVQYPGTQVRWTDCQNVTVKVLKPALNPPKRQNRKNQNSLSCFIAPQNKVFFEQGRPVEHFDVINFLQTSGMCTFEHKS